MKSLEEIKEILIKEKPLLREKYRVKEIGIFGSYLRRDQRRKSDLDILVEFEEAPGLLGFIELEERLSDTIGVKVDLVMKSALKPHIGKRILEEVMFI